MRISLTDLINLRIYPKIFKNTDIFLKMLLTKDDIQCIINTVLWMKKITAGSVAFAVNDQY